MTDDTCVCCGDYVPEGRQVCSRCEKSVMTKEINMKVGRGMRKMKTRRASLTWVIILAASFILFALGSQAALMERGYAADGGEFLLLFVPTVIYIIGRAVRGVFKDFKRLYDAAPEE